MWISIDFHEWMIFFSIPLIGLYLLPTQPNFQQVLLLKMIGIQTLSNMTNHELCTYVWIFVFTADHQQCKHTEKWPSCIMDETRAIASHFDMITSSNGKVFYTTGPLWGESTGHRWFPITKGSKCGALTIYFMLDCISRSANSRMTFMCQHCNVWDI